MKTTAIFLCSALAGLVFPALAHDQVSPADRPLGDPAVLLVASSSAPLSGGQFQDLIGHSVHDPKGGYVGSIDAVYVNSDRSVKEVIVGLSDPTSTGDHDVALKWNALQFSDEGKRITVGMSLNDLEALPRFNFADASQRGKIFSDTE